MQDAINELLKGHAQLREQMGAMLALLGRAKGPGWDDATRLDMQSVHEAEFRFSAALKDHESTEERFLSAAISRLSQDGRLAAGALESEHRALKNIFELLQSVTWLCDGEHIHRLRWVMSATAEILERHLSYEERELFPLILQDQIRPASDSAKSAL